ncbi:galactokinase [Thermodesulfobacteriota bacterium]
MNSNILKQINFRSIETSAPCRIDMGGTLDIPTFHYPLSRLKPCTFNVALDLRTRVKLLPNNNRKVKITSRGFAVSEYTVHEAPFNHPLGLMFAIAAYFGAEGVHITIDSSSPPKSALGGSSVAAIALIAAFLKASGQQKISKTEQRYQIAQLAHKLEESVAGVPCGMQDQLAAVFGGINAWHWLPTERGVKLNRESLSDKPHLKDFKRHLLLAYCGIPHESKHINSTWVDQFITGKHRNCWVEIVSCTKAFVAALKRPNYKAAVVAMNRETAIRREMTPEVLDRIGVKLVESAIETHCGARFTGAGGGGCVWALGSIRDIDRLRTKWEVIL